MELLFVAMPSPPADTGGGQAIRTHRDTGWMHLQWIAQGLFAVRHAAHYGVTKVSLSFIGRLKKM